MKGVFDTNILVDYLGGEARSATTLADYEEKVISRITWIEVLIGAKNASDETRVRSFLSVFRSEVSVPVAESAVQIRRGTPKLKLPDAIIYATAKDERCNLLKGYRRLLLSSSRCYRSLHDLAPCPNRRNQSKPSSTRM
jgi:predicted nucleic acid-binding protein